MEEQQASSNTANVTQGDGAPKCLYCKLAIEKDAVVCHNCGRSQKRFWIWIDESTRITAIAMVLIAITQVILAYQQGQDAKHERIAASEALDRARKTETILDSLLSKELKKLQFRNNITSLGDSVIADGNRRAFVMLMAMADSVDPVVRFAAQSERLRVYSFFSSIKYNGEVVDTLANGKLKREREFSTNELIGILKNDIQWQRRAASARVLGRQKSKGVPEALLYCMKNDQNLFVVTWAIDGFEYITGCSAKDTFGFEELYTCWKEKSAEINQNLKENQ